MSEGAPPDKEVLLSRFRAYRSALSPTAYADHSARIVARTRALPEVLQAGTVHVYWPLTRRREVDTRALIAWLHAAGKQVVLPVVASFAGAGGAPPRLRHLRFGPGDVLRPNRWGIEEPIGLETVPPEMLDVVVVPALGAGRNGHRLGHGHGYYDAFLREVAAPTVGLIYGACLVDAVPAAAHDVPLTVLVTEDEVVRPAPQGPRRASPFFRL